MAAKYGDLQSKIECTKYNNYKGTSKQDMDLA